MCAYVLFISAEYDLSARIYKSMRVGVYAGSLRPGGGVTVLRQIISALAENRQNCVIVYTGAEDTCAEIQDLVFSNPNIEHRYYFQNSSVLTRYLTSKVYFLRKSVSSDLDWLISFNYHVPAGCPVMVYHINLLSFQSPETDSLGMYVKRLDAKMACRYAEANTFESRYLLSVAERALRKPINNPGLLYVGVNSEFFRSGSGDGGTKSTRHQTDILLVSSTQKHKDNETCLKMLSNLVSERPEIAWRLVVVGGQSASQWNTYYEYAKCLGLEKYLFIAGRVDRNKLSNMMSESLCLVSASKVESFCMVALESMASGCPAIVTNVTSMPESVGGAAVTVEPGNAAQFAEAVIRFYDDDQLRERYVELGKCWVENYTFGQFRKSLINLLSGAYEGCTGEKRE